MVSWVSIAKEGERKQNHKKYFSDNVLKNMPIIVLKFNCPFKKNQTYHLPQYNCTWRFLGIDEQFRKYMWFGETQVENNGNVTTTIYYTKPKDHKK
uniref:Uncharacterized protein n=1 Tax=Marseillevirus LCMAC102 TaxID=2506603 RepID=A0A481YSI4_9VIRU|nr:MAG: hypothetical protein LCMAC102_00270 [Marseillevirus LCMAC102]